MNNIFNAVKLDFMTAIMYLRFVILTLVLCIFIGAATHAPLMTVVFTMVFAIFLGGTIFQNNEKNHTEKLYGLLPLKRYEMIAGRYLYGLIVGLANIIIACVAAFELSLISHVPIASATLFAVSALMFVYYCFCVAITYPIYYKFTMTKAYILTMLPLYLVFLAAVLIGRKTNFLNHVGEITKFFQDNQALTPVLGLAAGLVLVAASAFIANLIYTKKEL